MLPLLAARQGSDITSLRYHCRQQEKESAVCRHACALLVYLRSLSYPAAAAAAGEGGGGSSSKLRQQLQQGGQQQQRGVVAAGCQPTAELWLQRNCYTQLTDAALQGFCQQTLQTHKPDSGLLQVNIIIK